MIKKTTFSKLAIYLLLICMVSFTSVVYAEDQGDGSGGGTDVALTLVSSTPTNGATEVATNTTFELLFNKNVVNLAIQEINRNSISLKDDSGNTVAIDILFPDDQIDRDHRRNIYVDPLSDLQPYTTYHLLIDSSFMAKNGTQIDKSHTVTFTTKTMAETTPQVDEQAVDRQQPEQQSTQQTELNEHVNSEGNKQNEQPSNQANDQGALDEQASAALPTEDSAGDQSVVDDGGSEVIDSMDQNEPINESANQSANGLIASEHQAGVEPGKNSVAVIISAVFAVILVSVVVITIIKRKQT